jgi:hypothetical protein
MSAPTTAGRASRPMPMGLLVGATALALLVGMGGAVILAKGPDTDGSRSVGPLPVETPEAAESVLDPTPLDAPSEFLEPGALPVARDEVEQLHERLAELEHELERLRQRHAGLATVMDTLIAGEPWARATGHDAAVLDEVRAHAERLARAERRLNTLEAVQRECTRAAASQPPFELIAIDWWNHQPYATLRSQGRYTRVQEGESVSGWLLDRMDGTRREAVFRKTQSGQVVHLTAQDD